MADLNFLSDIIKKLFSSDLHMKNVTLFSFFGNVNVGTQTVNTGE